MKFNKFDWSGNPEVYSTISASGGRHPNGRHPIHTRLNGFLLCIVIGGTMFQLFGLPFVLFDYGTHAAWLLVPITLLQPPHWGLIHEGIHNNLFPNRRANEIGSRLLCVTLGIPFDGTRFGHMVHHRYCRFGHDRPDIFSGKGFYALAWLRYRLRLFGGVYLGLLLVPLIACMPRLLGVRIMKIAVPADDDGDAAIQRMFVSLIGNTPTRRRTRREFAATLVLYGASAWLYGIWWPVLLAAMYLRGLWHSFADNIAHHGVALDEQERAHNYALPPFFRPFVMNHHLHLTHHLFPKVPWTSLAALRISEVERPKGNYLYAALRQMSPFYPHSAINDDDVRRGTAVQACDGFRNGVR